MMTVPTPAEFLASSEPDEEYDDLEPADVRARIATLEGRVYALETEVRGVPVPVVLDRAPAPIDFQRLQRDVESEARLDRAVRAEALIEQIEGIVKKSTSQVSLAVKAAIEAWRTPAETAEPDGEPAPDGHISKAERDQMLGTETPSPAPGTPAVDEAAGPGIPSQGVQQASAGEGSSSHSATASENSGAGVLTQPAHDAPVEEWRSYAKALRGATGESSIDTMNRSQIRTMLGVEQPVAPAGA